MDNSTLSDQEEDEEEEQESESEQPEEHDDTNIETSPIITYDDETQKLVEQANTARSELQEAEQQIRTIETDIKNIEDYLEKDFGPEEEYAVLQVTNSNSCSKPNYNKGRDVVLHQKVLHMISCTSLKKSIFLYTNIVV